MSAASTDEQDRADMARLLAGEENALDDLMARHASRLFHYLLRLLQNQSEAEDIAEEVFVRVYEHRSRFDLRKSFSTWVYTIATNLVRDLQRHRARHPRVSLDAESAGGPASFREMVADTQPGPGELLDRQERSEHVRDAIAHLPDELRVPLVLFVYEDKSHAEIAEMLECSPKAIEMRLYRARSELRSRLEKVLAPK
jgi:RNA polymerase sigma-70 factor (ECF subfamily)